MTDKVYIVTSGSYSDYSIEAVFLDRAKADEYSKLASCFSGVEVHDVHAGVPNPIKVKLSKGWKYYWVCMKHDGNVSNSYSYDFPYIKDNNNFAWEKDINGGVVLLADIWARNEKRAIKVVNERRTMDIAEGRDVPTKTGQHQADI